MLGLVRAVEATRGNWTFAVKLLPEYAVEIWGNKAVLCLLSDANMRCECSFPDFDNISVGTWSFLVF